MSQGYLKANQTAYAMDTLKWGTDYLLKLYHKSPYSTSEETEYYIIYQVAPAGSKFP